MSDGHSGKGFSQKDKDGIFMFVVLGGLLVGLVVTIVGRVLEVLHV